ncbi:uncharacterized protein LOC119683400 isoform X1 [Teleopsis dalmanni]|uniref:uncharacterized protein LOC119683400 isoform X1 n=1 Tax=Teleopsis dalmanni TaxID=139649 RepID=UPI0018CE2F9F|nr:uncharacterized protein LOC119683400 isoform X1 [Teleopsis dalmanni]
MKLRNYVYILFIFTQALAIPIKVLLPSQTSDETIAPNAGFKKAMKEYVLIRALSNQELPQLLRVSRKDIFQDREVIHRFQALRDNCCNKLDHKTKKNFDEIDKVSSSFSTFNQLL